ncbi:MAG: hypothetical protein LC776_00695, partial [Acidobacteria bacterium]|nr:hypothetical protein [Acidobacteriota bacterium]
DHEVHLPSLRRTGVAVPSLTRYRITTRQAVLRRTFGSVTQLARRPRDISSTGAPARRQGERVTG